LRTIIVNLPVKDLAASTAFFSGLGFRFNPDMASDRRACIAVEENILVMLLTEDQFEEVIVGEISDAAKTEVLVCLSVDSREMVDETIEKALASGGQKWRPTGSDGDFYFGSFRDLDSHVWELLFMG
jgi:uncharacterized protein